VFGRSLVSAEGSRRWCAHHFFLNVSPRSAFLRTDDPKLPPIPSRLALVRLFLELALYTPALLVLHGIMSSDDQEVEAWYLEGWCFYLMAEQARESGGTVDDLTWEELAKDARDCLETCQVVCVHCTVSSYPY
jgi:hypothetical protein